jgi:hypothetical protein
MEQSIVDPNDLAFLTSDRVDAIRAKLSSSTKEMLFPAHEKSESLTKKKFDDLRAMSASNNSSILYVDTDGTVILTKDDLSNIQRKHQSDNNNPFAPLDILNE